MNVLIVGASRGLGLEFVRQYRAAGARVTATARDDAGEQRIAELGARPLRLDVADAASASGLAWQIDGERFDVVVVNAGVFGPRADALQTPTEADFDAVMRTNVLGPMRLLPQVADHLADGARVALISSRMGSIGLRTGSSGWLYRASKAALNSVMKDASLALAAKATVISFHPGWVRTDMGGSGADIDAPTSIAGMRTVLASVKPADTGSFFNYDGQRLDF
ncbi:SDR family oxidoreductase [Pelomonas aquatica]|jgi:NAD(P)-dependent dehydrogenase (short-subunit alcohol dehydrogenase family)|uniref:SDR family oxidoreductase n=1 Tax=Pelomonas aquatica TaxID=431058 RepID=A0A9X4LKW2_9BURK|nr:SDR family oxidoreductase [Pelomonas aquatica]MCY4756244.1 SDR family oxidoreductase [Pelomonas aquatica]MDG0865128.1 SDR family oxidoreductase [Pelomonas aquatica]